ncbi:MAG: type III-B CRISPR module-associated protein Cmr5 [Candidatus Electrothrix sp. AR4]|nr:type III-B CRISPR module-associated protein Cmr5 [Candidatus Electrothrix sp. AR4]
MNRTREQYRAGYALRFVKDYAKSGDKAKMHTLIQKAPIQILQNGLGQMLAFLLADNEGKQEKQKPSGILYRRIEEWLCGDLKEDRPCRVYLNDPKQEELIEQLTAGDRNQYTQAQQEALALFAWLKKFADAWLKEGGK